MQTSSLPINEQQQSQVNRLFLILDELIKLIFKSGSESIENIIKKVIDLLKLIDWKSIPPVVNRTLATFFRRTYAMGENFARIVEGVL